MLTGQEFASQNFLPNRNKALKYHHQTSYPRQPLMVDDLWWKMTFGGRQPSVKDNLQWKTTFGGKQSLHAA